MEGNIEIIRYNPELRQEWDEFVESSKNGTFLFNRAYMDYHSHRFTDHSLLFYRKGKLYCLLPANIKEDTIYSHQGLTYGGLIMNDACTAEGILQVFDALVSSLRKDGIKKLVYKPVPYIYQKYLSGEDLYALFRQNALLSVRNISSALNKGLNPACSTLRKRRLKKAKADGVEVKISTDYQAFWDILSSNLEERYGAKPVHSLTEIMKLSTTFPENIKLFGAYQEEEMTAGIVVYLSSQVAHMQYISSNPKGKTSGAVDAVIHKIICEYKENRYIDFGTSNEDGGRFLNTSLIHQKEGFGARAVCYDTYEIQL